MVCFRLLMEYYSFLFYCKIDTFNGEVSFRLLTEYYSFLCKVYSLETIRLGKCVSVSLRSIIHSYFKSWRAYLYRYRLGLVSVSLRSIIHSYKLVKNSAFGGYYLAFPSPYGVSFILINLDKFTLYNYKV